MFIFDLEGKDEYMALRGIDFGGPRYDCACIIGMILILMMYCRF